MQTYLNQSRQVLSVFIHCVEMNKGRKEIRQVAVIAKRQSRKVGSFQTLCFLTQEGFNLFFFFFLPPFKLLSTLQSSNSLSPHVSIWSRKTLNDSTFFSFFFFLSSFKLKRLTQKRLPRFYLVKFFFSLFFPLS